MIPLFIYGQLLYLVTLYVAPRDDLRVAQDYLHPWSGDVFVVTAGRRISVA